MKGHREKLKDGYEYDLVYKAPLCLFKNVKSIKKYIKKKINRRERAKIKRELEGKINEW